MLVSETCSECRLFATKMTYLGGRSSAAYYFPPPYFLLAASLIA